MKIKQVFFLSLLGMSFYFIALVVTCSIPDNVIKSTYKIDCICKYVNTLFPQGWGFFTNNPRQQRVRLYYIKKNEIVEFNCKNTQLKHLYGIKKANRKIIQTLKSKLVDIPKNLWYPTNENIQKISVCDLNTVGINLSSNVFPKGKYIVSIAEPLPWIAFSSKKNKLKMGSKNIIVDVK